MSHSLASVVPVSRLLLLLLVLVVLSTPVICR